MNTGRAIVVAPIHCVHLRLKQVYRLLNYAGYDITFTVNRLQPTPVSLERLLHALEKKNSSTDSQNVRSRCNESDRDRGSVFRIIHYSSQFDIF